MTRPLILATLLLAATNPAVAQQHQHGQSPYAGLEGREIKALSPEQLQQLRDGEGMGMALPAELNHYPGPMHVQALADELGLSVTQREQVRAIEGAMRARAVGLGAEIIEGERLLDQAFAKGEMTDDALRQWTAEIARLQGELRYAHLSAHLGVRRALTEAQIVRYDELRGYRQAPAPR